MQHLLRPGVSDLAPLCMNLGMIYFNFSGIQNADCCTFCTVHRGARPRGWMGIETGPTLPKLCFCGRRLCPCKGRSDFVSVKLPSAHQPLYPGSYVCVTEMPHWLWSIIPILWVSFRVTVGKQEGTSFGKTQTWAGGRHRSHSELLGLKWEHSNGSNSGKWLGF